MKGRVLVLVFALLLSATGVALAVYANWYRLAEVVGTIRPATAALAPVRIELGVLQPNQRFSSLSSTNLTCSTRCNVSKLIVAVPVSAGDPDAMVRALRELKAFITFDGCKLVAPGVRVCVLPAETSPLYIPIVVDGAIKPEHWRLEYSDGGMAYYSYRQWVPEPLTPGPHTVAIRLHGETSVPTQQVNLNIVIYLEVVPA